MMTSTATLAVPDLAEQFRAVRRASALLCEPLATEDYVAQSMTDASPVKWHLAHTTWFFETLVLRPHKTDYRSINEAFEYLFNSYYNTIGPQYSRPHRGLVTRPTVSEVREYRAYVDRQMEELFEQAEEGDVELPTEIITIGMHHEQQHQELIVTDLKHLFSFNPLHPVYHEVTWPVESPVSDLRWYDGPEGVVEIGHDGPGFAYDNETPRHHVYLRPYRLASRLITCGEFKAFMADGGYARSELWLSDGWATVNERDWKAPLYWEQRDGQWFDYTLGGFRPVRDDEPVCHVSYYEADAYARWAGARLATEAEWEAVAAAAAMEGNFGEDGFYHPFPVQRPIRETPAQLFGDVWEWTQSGYASYPGYQQPEGAVGEYNAKFMCNQLVLRGGSCATPRSHIRSTYRNFFSPDARWQFSGIRLARDVR
jgi:ergothioneine biosynthesis protein EgtB